MASSKIATAYVQVMPSMEGVAPKVKSFFGSTGKSSGSLFGSGFGGSLVSTIKNVLVSAGIGTALKETLTAGGDLQQSLGGVNTLFKDSANTVIENAKQAYMTAGMSANAYMETVTGFSASLINSLGGDTAAAANVANTALVDMSDNANKMGTSMELIQNAYQGFAKQNYTMLDNLKLGYGGTKTEMERLIADANKVKKANGEMADLSIDSFADVVEAIHTIQEEMGIMGATSEEASTTLIGSFNSMKAAFTDVLGNLALGEDITPSLNALADTTGTFLMGNLVPMVTNIITALPGSVSTFLNALIPENANQVVTTAITSFTAYVTENLPMVLESGSTTLASFMSGISQMVPSLFNSATEIIQTLSSYIINDPGKLLAPAGELFASLVTGLANLLPTLVDSAVNIISSLGGYLIEHAPDIVAAAGEIGAEIAHGIWDSLVSVWNGIANIPGLLSGLENFSIGGSDALLGSVKPIYPHAKGLDYVPYDGYLAELHKGEMVLTSKQASAVRSGNLPTRGVTVIQHIHSEAKTAADLMQEARYQQELAVMMGV